MRHLALLGVLVILLAAATEVRADTVDWSQYIDTNPSKPLVVHKAQPAPAPTTVRPAKRTAKPAKTVASKAKAKPRARAKPRRK